MSPGDPVGDGGGEGEPFPLVSVIVPVFRNPAGLRRCLDALDAQDWPAHRREIVVVDNGPEGDGEPVARDRRGVRYLRESAPGSYAARNRGIAAASGSVVAFTDADCVPDPDWIRRGATALAAAPGCGLLVGRIRITFADPARPTAVELYESVASFRQSEYVRRWRFGATANVFTRRGVLETAGRFDARFLSLGDLEWGRRVAGAGFELVYDPGVVVRHPARRTLREFTRRAARMAGGFRTLVLRSGIPRRTLFAYAALGLVPLTALVARGPDAPLRGAASRLRVLGVACLIVAVRVFELVRLSLGGRPGR